MRLLESKGKVFLIRRALIYGLRSHLFLIVLMSCTLPARGAFRPMKILHKQPCDTTLTAASDIPHTCWRSEARQAKLPVWQFTLDFEFGQLTKPQWRKLLDVYASWHRHRTVAYDPHRSYTLMDFMPPLMQALNAHQFHEEEVSLPQPLGELVPRKNQGLDRASLIANCWGTLYEILRTSRSVSAVPFTFIAGPDQMAEWLQQQTMPITDRARTGDILLIYHRLGDRTYLDHVALMVDDQVFFEKAGTGNDTPYRLVDRETLEQSWRPDLFTFELRRLNAKSLQPPQQQFGLHSQSTLAVFPEFAGVSPSLAQNFSLVWFREQEVVTKYFYQMRSIHLVKGAEGRSLLAPAHLSSD